MTPDRPRCVLNWSTGKDSAWALDVMRRAGELDVVGLLTTVNERYDRVAMHAVRHELLDEQARAAGLPLTVVGLPSPCTNDEYEQRMGAVVRELKSDGIEVMAFGDLFLQDIREYRARQLAKAGLRALFPLWGEQTDELARQMINNRVRAIVTCVDSRLLEPEFSGREWNDDFLEDLPETVDPCGENGEFHTFVFDGPMFARPLSIELGERVERDGFVFTDVRLRSTQR